MTRALPKGGRQVRLKRMFSYAKGLNITKADLVDDGVAVVSYGQIHAKHNTGTHLDPSLIRYVPEEIAAACPNSKLKKGDVVFADTSEDLEGVGNCVLIDSDGVVYAGYHALIASARFPEHSKYLSYLFQTDAWRGQIRTRASGIKVFSLTQRVLNPVTVILPPLPEQTAIAEILSTADREIELLMQSIEQEKLKKTLEILTLEDPTFTYKDNEETGQLVISGMGELHLDVLVTRITKEFKVDCNIGKPQVTYRESITSTVEKTYTFSKVLAGKENSATVTLRLSPLEPKSGTVYENLVSSRTIPQEMFDAVQRGVENSFRSGIKFGYEACDMKVELIDLKYSELTATEFAYEACAAMCFDAAAQEAGPVLMEPVMDVTLIVPSQYVGDTISSLTQRGGIVSSMESKTSADHIIAQAPLSKLFGYSTALRSSTQGRGTFSMEFSHFAPKTDR